MRRALVLLAVLLFAGAAFAQPAQLAPCLVSGTDCAAASGAVTGTLTSGRVTLSTGATTVGDDAGCTWTGTGASFALHLASQTASGLTLSVIGSRGLMATTGDNSGYAGFLGSEFSLGNFGKFQFSSTASPAGTVDLALSRASAGTLLVEDGSGNARDVTARTANLTYAAISGLEYPTSDNGIDTGSGSNRWRSGYFGTSVYSPLLSTAPDATGTNTAGANLTIRPGAGTGSAAGSSIVFQTPTATGSGTTGQTQTTRLSIAEAGATFAGPITSLVSGTTTQVVNIGPSGSELQFAKANGSGDGWIGTLNASPLNLGVGNTYKVTVLADGSAVTLAVPIRLKGYTVATLPAGTVGDTAYVTDATAPTYLGALTGGGAVTTPVFYNGAAWVSH